MENVIKHKGFVGSVNYNDADEVFHGKLEYITDLVTFEGTTVEELKAAFREAVEDYIETCQEIGKEPQKPFKGSFNVRVTPELHKKAALIALEKHVALNQVVAEALSQYIGTTVTTSYANLG